MDTRTTTGRLSYGHAHEKDLPAIYALMNQSMDDNWGMRIVSNINLTADRESHIVARRGDTVLAYGQRRVLPVRHNGRSSWLGYLATLRRDPSMAGTDLIIALTNCLHLLHTERQADEYPYDLTSILYNNVRAKRLLERGIRGMPHYHPWQTYTTSLFSARAAAQLPTHNCVRIAQEQDKEALYTLLESQSSTVHLDYRRLPFPDRVWIWEEQGHIQGCLALSHQGFDKHIAITRMPAALSLCRHPINVLRTLQKRPPLPPPHVPIQQGMLGMAHCNTQQQATALLAAAGRYARNKALHILCLGMSKQSLFTSVLPTEPLSAQWYGVSYDDWKKPDPATIDASVL